MILLRLKCALWRIVKVCRYVCNCVHILDRFTIQIELFNIFKDWAKIELWILGDITSTVSVSSSVDFFDDTFTFSKGMTEVTCCAPDNIPRVATCGQGVSCAGQCSALGASLCPSGACTDDPSTCEVSFESGEDQRSGRSTDTYSGSYMDWCTNAKHQCQVRKHKDCCYNPKCLKWKGRKEACAWLNYLTGIKRQKYKKIEGLKWQHFRHDMQVPWQPSPWQLDLWDSGDSNPGHLLLGRCCPIIPRWVRRDSAFDKYWTKYISC